MLNAELVFPEGFQIILLLPLFFEWSIQEMKHPLIILALWKTSASIFICSIKNYSIIFMPFRTHPPDFLQLLMWEKVFFVFFII